MPCPQYVNSPYGQILAVTAASRPTGTDLYEGRFIYETDTDRIWAYDGTVWVFKDWNSAAARPGVSLTDTPQSITSSTLSDITWATEVSDPDNWTSGGSATVTVPAGWDGLYVMMATGGWATSSLGTTPELALLVNGALIYAANGLSPNGVHALSATRGLVAGDIIKVQAYQNSGVPVTITSSLVIAWLGR